MFKSAEPFTVKPFDMLNFNEKKKQVVFNDPDGQSNS